MRHVVAVSVILTAILAASGCASAPGNITPHKWSAEKPSTRVSGYTWPAFDSVSHARKSLPDAGSADVVWSEAGIYARLSLPADAPRQVSVNLLYTHQDGQVRKGRVRVQRDGNSIQTSAERTDPGTDEWIPAGETVFSRAATDLSAQPPSVYVFLAWETVGLEAPPEDRAWVVVDPAGWQRTGKTPPPALRFYFDPRPRMRGPTGASCPYCTQ